MPNTWEDIRDHPDRLERHRANGRRWMAKWRAENPEESKRRSRDAYFRQRDKAFATRRFSAMGWRSAQQGAARRGLEFSVRREDIAIPTHCPVLGVELSYDSYDTTPSLDRIDNSKGYVPGNVAVISRRANRLKDNATIEEVRAILRYMEEHLGG